MTNKYRRRRLFFVIFLLIITAFIAITGTSQIKTDSENTPIAKREQYSLALAELDKLPIKGRAPKTDYSRDQFGDGWRTIGGCDTRNIILNRDLKNVSVDSNCRVIMGILDDPYTDKTINFIRGDATSDDVQIDHVVALSDAWQKGAQQLSFDNRIDLANDPLELLAVSGQANQQKGDSDAASWLPKNKSFRCEYVSRQIAVKRKYALWVTRAEYDAIKSVLNNCQNQLLPNP